MTGGLRYKGDRRPSGNMVRDALSTDEPATFPNTLLWGPTVCVGAYTLAMRLALTELPDVLVAVGVKKDS